LVPRAARFGALTEPFWTHVVPVGDIERATMDLSKDNVVFGVRSVSHGGLRSPAVFSFPSESG
jgi:hypothetical protein